MRKMHCHFKSCAYVLFELFDDFLNVKIKFSIVWPTCFSSKTLASNHAFLVPAYLSATLINFSMFHCVT